MKGSVSIMKFAMSGEELARLTEALRANDDCEEAGDGSFIVDLYEPEPAVSLELYIEKGGIAITAVGLLSYSKELDGWYMSDRIEDKEGIAAVFARLKEAFL